MGASPSIFFVCVQKTAIIKSTFWNESTNVLLWIINLCVYLTKWGAKKVATWVGDRLSNRNQQIPAINIIDVFITSHRSNSVFFDIVSLRNFVRIRLGKICHCLINTEKKLSLYGFAGTLNRWTTLYITHVYTLYRRSFLFFFLFITA